jgi:hypothetical protein
MPIFLSFVPGFPAQIIRNLLEQVRPFQISASRRHDGHQPIELIIGDGANIKPRCRLQHCAGSHSQIQGAQLKSKGHRHAVQRPGFPGWS